MLSQSSSQAALPREGPIPDTEATIDEAHREQLLGFLLCLTRDRAEAEDLVQESLLAVWTKRDRYEGRGSFIGFLRQTAFRLFLNHVARRRRRQRLALAAPGERRLPHCPQEEVDEADAHERLMSLVREAVDGLPAEQRDAFLLFRFEGLSCAQVAARLGAPLKTVETRIRRATLHVAERLAPHRHLLR